MRYQGLQSHECLYPLLHGRGEGGACRDWFICCRLGSIPNGAGSMVKYVVSFFSGGARGGT